MRTHLYGQLPGDLAHHLQHGEVSLCILDELVPDGGHFLVEQQLDDAPLRYGKMQEGEDRLSLIEHAELKIARGGDLEYHFRSIDDLLRAITDERPHVTILFVFEERRRTGNFLDVDRVPRLNKRSNTCVGKGNATFVDAIFFQYADIHSRIPRSCSMLKRHGSLPGGVKNRADWKVGFLTRCRRFSTGSEAERVSVVRKRERASQRMESNRN